MTNQNIVRVSNVLAGASSDPSAVHMMSAMGQSRETGPSSSCLKTRLSSKKTQKPNSLQPSKSHTPLYTKIGVFRTFPGGKRAIEHTERCCKSPFPLSASSKSHFSQPWFIPVPFPWLNKQMKVGGGATPPPKKNKRKQTKQKNTSSSFLPWSRGQFSCWVPVSPLWVSAFLLFTFTFISLTQKQDNKAFKSRDSGARWIWNLALAFINCVILGRLFKLSGPLPLRS